MNKILEILADQIFEPAQRMRLEIDSAGLDDLAESIRQNGLINPITVRPVYCVSETCNSRSDQGIADHSSGFHDRYEIVAGNRRYLACLRAGVVRIPCVIREMTQDEADSVMAHENLVRQDLDPVEEAVYCARLVGDDESKIFEVARKVNRSEVWVRERLAILDFPDYLLQAIRNGEIKIGVAQWLAAVEDDFWRREWVKQAISHGMSVLQARYLYDQYKMGIFKSSEEAKAELAEYQSGALPLARAICAACQQMAEEPNLQMVWLHKKCSDSAAPPPQKSESEGGESR